MTSGTEATEKINVLFVSATVPYPAIDGGRIRTLNLILRLCRVHKVTLLTFINSPLDEQGVEYLREMGAEVVGVRRRKPNILADSFSLLRNSFSGKPLTVAKYHSVEMVRVLEDLLKSRKFDIVHFEMLHTGQLILHLQRLVADLRNCEPQIANRRCVRTVLSEQNIDSNIWYRLARSEPNPLRKLIFYSQYRRFMNYESRICHHFDLCICVSAQDRSDLASLCPGMPIEIVPNGVDLDYFKPIEGKQDETSLVFTGSMDWRPNEDAVLYFCDHILPLIQAEIPEITFYIVGSNPTGRVLRLGRAKGVVVTGSVADVRPYIANSAVFVVPLRIGSGTRLKILQALAMEKAVISTTIGCEGLEIQPDRHLIIADEPRQFAADTVQLVRNAAMRRRLGKNGRMLVQERYGWDVIFRGLEFAYRKSLTTRKC